MFKKIAYSFIFFSLFIIQGHNVVIHHHDAPHMHENGSHHDNEGHNVFSLIDLNNEFTSQNKLDISYNPVAEGTFSTAALNLKETTHINVFNSKNEYPPPKPSISFKSLRAPPKNFIC